MNDRHEITCERILDWIDDAARDRLDPDRAARLEAHVARCDDCRGALDDARAVRALVRSAVPPRCPDAVVGRILDEVTRLETQAAASAHESGSGTATTSPVLIHLRRFLGGRAVRPVAVGAALILIVVIGLQNRGRLVGGGDATTARVETAAPTGPGSGFDPEDVELAAEEARLAFAIVARAMNHTARAVEGEMRQSVTRCVIEGMEQGIERLPPPLDAGRDGAAASPVDPNRRA